MTAVEAKVFGDVKIYLNGMDKSFYDAADATMKTVFDTRITKPEGATYYLVKTTETKGAVVKRVFGANNKNGSPQRNVTVHVFGTQHKDAENILTKLKNANADLEQGSQTDDQYKTVLKGVLTDMITKAGILHIAVTNSEGTGYQDICNNTTSTADALKKAINDINDEINAKILDENTSADDIDALFAQIYDVEAVYGGGNEAAYIPTTAYHPTNAPTGSKTQVIIEGCDETSIEAVYGGGNAASVPETNVDIVSAHEIQTVFGGGNGKDNKSDGSANPGADVGVYKVGTTETIYGTGNATTLLEGGYFHEAYGASNSKGNIKGNISINTNPAGSCNLKYDKLVGAGKNADVDKDVIMILGCNPRTKNPLIFGGADNANVNGNVELTITSGTFGKVFGGNNLGGIIKGHIKVNIEETECTPIRIDELYLGGNQAAYSIYGYYQDASDNNKVKPRTAAMHAIAEGETGYVAPLPNPAEDATHTFPYAQPVLNVISCTYIGKVFGGGYGERAVLYGNPTVNINMIAGRWANELGAADKLGEIVDVFGGGNAAKVEGNTTVNIGTATKVGMVTAPTYLETSAYTQNTTTGLYEVTSLGANIAGNVYGGGNEADVTGNTFVNICAVKSGDTYSAVAEGTKKVNIAGSVFGGGKGIADNFYCDKAMVGTDKAGETAGYLDGNTSVIIGNGTVNGSVYGGGEIGRVEMNTAVTIGIEGGTTTSAPRIKGNVFGAGKGLETHGYAALVRGNPIVTIQGNAKVDSCVYGGGEIASVARYQVVGGVPVALAGEEGNYSGYCTVNVLGNAIIGPDEKMVMHHVDAQGNTVNGSDGFPLLPDDAGHVFAAGKGVLPKIYTYADNDHRPKRMLAYNDETISKISSGEIAYWEYSDAPTKKNIWQYFKNETQYFEFIQTLALATQTAVTVDGNAFVKGSVYGGSQNGLVQYDTHVTIDGNCQIGCGKNTTDRHPDAVWGETYPVTEGTNLECASWEYDPLSGAPYDPYAKYLYNGKYYYDEAHTKYAEGGSIVAKDGHTYYGNVFGGGSGSVPYFDTEKGISRYIPTAGEVKRDTYVTISGGHILTNVYGGNEATNVLGTAHVTMTGGTIGVPRTPQQIKDHPVTCYLFGAGKGDQRIFFNKETNVKDAIVTVEGGRIYGSVFGGGEDGHVLRNTEVTIGKDDGAGPNIGTVGSTYVDGNVFGGGRGFSGEALTAGNVGGSVDLIINGGTMLGSIYGGGRLASVGYGLYLTTETGYGVMRDDKEYDGSYPNPSPDDAEIFYNKGRGHITVTVNGGTIGKEFESDVEGEHSGNVFGGSMGRLTKLDGSSFDNSHWPLLATAKSTTVNINGGTIKRSVYGGGEMGTVTTDAIVNVSGGTIGTSGKGGAEFGNVYGGGKGYVDPAGSNYVTAGIIKGNTKVTVENGTNTTPTIYHNIYGGGAYGSVGTFSYDENNNVITGYTSGGKAEIYVTGGTIGTDGKENGMIFGSSRGDIGRPGSIHDKLAWVYDTHVAIGDTATNATITTATPLIKGSIYGGGENGHNYRNAYVRINGGTIGINNNETITYKDDPKDADKVTYTGKDYNYPYRGNVYGGGCGTDKYYSTGTESHDGNGDTYNSKAGIVQGNAIVHISAGNIVRNVYGAGAMGSVGTMTKDNDDHLVISSGGKTTIEISGGTVGVDGTDNGNVFGAARGDETTKQTDVALVKTTDVTISGGATVVWGNVYGGGQIGCVGTFTERVDDGKYIWTSDAQNLNGLTKVSITGGETKGHVFGAGKGSAVTFKCEKAMVKKTQVSVSNGKVDKNVYGGGEIGRVEEDTDVKIGVGDGTCNPTISGSVYGAGAGLETHGYSALVRHNTTVTVDGGATIGQSVYGGGEIASVGRYGLDEHKMPEILLDGGYCYVKVQGSATIGSNTVQGNVFGACKGVVPHLGDKDDTDKTKRPRRMTVYTNATDFPEGAKIDATTGNASGTTSTGTTWEYYDESVTPQLVWEYFRTEKAYDTYLQTLALATHPEVTIDGGATVNGSVYGGGEMGLTKGSVMVNILGGSITEDVYGGGALANTNTTSAVGVLDNAGIPQKTNEQYQTTTVYPKTTVNLLGGSMRDAYGGGLGQLALAAQGTEGQAGYQAAVSAIEAKVNGDVKVNLNGLQAATDINTTILNSLTTGSKLDAVGSGYIVKSSAKGAVVNRVFGCNNLNGTPTKKVQVYVFGTQKRDETQLNAKAARNTNTYDVQAVYGGGNLAPYVPADALLDYEQNKATVDAARPEVYIDGCDLTSIKQVYGGGNAASVPATFVEIRRCYEIDEVFGGGNGYDDYSLVEHGETKWYKNPGANVGYYTGYYTNYATYSNYETRTSGGGSGTDSDPYLAVVNPIYDGDEIVVVNGVEKNMKETRLAAKNIQYGSGIARLEVKGGTIHTSYGGSNSKGNVRAKLSSAYSAMFDDCEMQVAQSYGGGKNAYSDAETDMVADCAKGVKEMFGGAKDADMNGDINMLITNGSSLERVFGGNNTSGAVNGSITITLQEGGCEPIKIGELYAGGFLAPYSVYGYKKTNGVYDTEEVEYIDTDGTTKTRAQRIPLESGTRLYKDPRINVISATSIGNIFGGGYQAKLVGNPHINVNMTTGFVKVTKTLKAGTTDEYIYKDAAGNEYAAEKVSEVSSDPSDLEAKSYIATTDLGTIGNIYGGGNMADIVGDTYVEIGTGTEHNDAGELVAITPARNGAKISGNVFGGGKGKADTFLCEKAMIGKDGDGVNNPDGGTHVTIGNGTVDGNVYGGGEIGRVEKNTVVTIGLADAGSDKSKPVIKGSVFGGGKGEEEHGYAALVRGNPTVTIQGKAKIGHNVYGGGEIASVARYKVATTAEEAAAHGVSIDMPYVLQNANSGKCTIIVRDNAEIGPNDMQMTKADGPDDMGHVFGAGKGIMPTIYTYKDDEHKPKRMILNADKTASIWEYFASEEKYIEFIQTLALATETDVTISGEAFVKGSVYGGSENGLVQYDTKVTIEGNCQIGNGEGKTERYTTTQWENENPADFKECAHWEYGLDTNGDGKKDLFAPYDPNANATGELGKYSSGKSTEGGRRVASDGHTFYGNVFGGGSGSVPYFDTTEGISKYLPSAGLVKGNTHVNINGGHILTNVYGGNEATNVLGMAYVTMTGGTIGVPRTAQQIKDHPVTCYLFGAGKGDQRIFFNKETNVNDAIVKVEGGRIYGSVFGGGEDGHVLRNTTVTIGKTDGTGPKIGTVGSTYVDGNVFGGGRGFGGEALTAGNVGGSVDLIINGGTMLGSIYGGGRLASVGYGLYLVNEEVGGVKPYGKMREDNEYDGSYPNPSSEAASAFYTKGRGHITVNINGGTIGSDVEDEHSGNVFGGSMGRLAKIDGSPFDDQNHWALLATAKTTEVNVTGGIIKRNVYGGGEMGTVIEKATVNISGGTIGKAGSDNVEIGNVFGGGKGYLDPAQTYVGAGIVKGNTNVTIKNGISGGTTTTPTIYQNVYGGGELGYVGMFTTPDHKEYTWTENTGLCTVGVAGGMITGHVFGAGKGHDDTFECERAMVRTTSVAVSGGKVGGNVYGGGEVGRVDQNSAVTIGSATGDSAPTITGSVFGAGAGVETHGYSALVRGNTAVIVQGNAKVGNSVYGGGQIAAVGRYGLDSSGMPSTLVNGGECVVTVQGNAVIGTNGTGNVFGAGMGVDESKKTYTYADNANRPKRMMTFASGLYTDANKELWEYSDDTHTYVWEYFDTREKYLNFLQTLALATDTRLTINGNASANGSVYGGSESGFVQRYTDVRILGGKIQTIADASGKITEGNVFGGGKGISDNDAAGRVRSDTKVTVLGGTVYGDVYGGGALGKANTLEATNTASVNLLGGVIEGNAFGGGLGNATTAADVGNTRVNLNGMTTEELNSFSGDFKTLLTTTLTGLKEYSKKGAVVKGGVFGANNVNGTPKGHVLVHVYATQNKDLATIKDKKVITSDEPTASDFDVTGVFGGGKQADYVPELTDAMQSTEVIIEGCDLTSIYEVYGGGYGAATPGTNVLINGTKIIDKVFGGGYGKSTTDFPDNPGANVGYRTVGKTLYGSHLNDEEKIAIVQLKAGKVNSVFGGSNTLGDIRNGSSITTLTSDEAGTQTDDPCEILEVGELYGGGNEAVMEGGAEIVLRCMPDSWIGEVYAGARKADVGNDVSLTITSGKFEQVFGGNKSDGKIDGYVEVNIEECPTCNTPVIIGELYGGGNEAEYTYPELDDDPNYPSPRVNVRAFTSIGTIYGGGKGKDAVVNGNPTVNVSVGMVDGGGQDYSGETRTVDSKDIQLYGHEKGKIGVIGDIFGGGNAAEVNGNTNVFIGTEKYVKLDRIVPGETDVSNYYIRTGTSSNYEYTPVPRTKATAAGTYYQRNQTGTYTEVSVSAGDDVSGYYTRSGEGTEVSPFVYAPVSPAQSNTVYCLPVLGADIQGNVYGGGNAAKVTGHTNVVIGKKAE